ncbi:MAG: NAD(P)-dependent oxidoreductase [Alphaproteobacteria bacterium]|nr:NAD(P)-dependent oxidoreductase [Alphaproteobacteria bacterium]
MARIPVGFVGLGRMGGPMAAHLLTAGHDLIAFDLDGGALAAAEANGARRAASAAEVASAAEIVLVSLPTPDIVQKVVVGEIARGNRVRTVVDLSTTGPRVATAIAAELAKTDRIAWVDSPVSGGVAGARAGTLAVMVSCRRDTFAEVEPLLARFGRIFFCGEEPGLAQTMKLANNLLAAAAVAVTSEAMAMGVKAGLDAKLMIDVINSGSGMNTATRDKFPRSVLPGSFDFGFATGLSLKDVRLCVEEAQAMGIPMVVGSAVCQLLAVTNATFGPASDFTNIARVVEQWAGVEVRANRQT